MFIGNDYQRGLCLKKQLILDVCEPGMITAEVKCRGNKFNMFIFGSFELDDKEYIFGTEEQEYHASFSDKTKNVFPVIFAKKEKTCYVLSPTGSFGPQELELINETITYTMESKHVMSHYTQSRCD